MLTVLPGAIPGHAANGGVFKGSRREFVGLEDLLSIWASSLLFRMS